MSNAVRYYSRGGNARKLAEAVAAELGVKAETTDSKLAADTDVVFLCNSVYWGGVDASVKAFIASPGAKIGKIVNVSTAALTDSSYPQMKKLCAKAGIPLASEEFHCKGSFKMLHRGKPDAADVQAVREFAKKVAES